MVNLKRRGGLRGAGCAKAAADDDGGIIVPVQNSDVTEIFEKVADLLEIEGENQFRVRAYQDTPRTVGGHSRSVAEMVEKGEDLTELPGIGEDLAGKIREMVETEAEIGEDEVVIPVTEVEVVVEKRPVAKAEIRFRRTSSRTPRLWRRT
jgi:hypothetical protein